MTSKNHLKKVVRVQNITLEYTQKGVTQAWVYKNIIQPNFFISERTYARYLAKPAKKQLKELLKKEQNAV
jgi:hypothetical protein